MPMRRAADARWKINDTLYAVQRYRRGGRGQPIPVSNTEGHPGNPDATDSPGFTSKLGDLREGQVELTSATFDDDDNPFAAPVSLVENGYYDLKHYPAGLDGDYAHYPNCICVSVDHSGSIPGGQPVTAVFETDGTYAHPGES